MEECYLLSLKWTYKDSALILFWGEGNCGYYYKKENIGIYDYDECINSLYHYNKHTFPVKKSIVDKLWCDSTYEGGSKIIPNKPWFRKELGINVLMLQDGEGSKSDYMTKSLPKNYKDIPNEIVKEIKIDGYRIKLKEDNTLCVNEWWYFDEEYYDCNRSQAKWKFFNKYHYDVSYPFDCRNEFIYFMNNIKIERLTKLVLDDDRFEYPVLKDY